MADDTQAGGRRKKTDEAVDRNLKRVYDDMIEDEVPERFAALLRQLRDQEASK
jgi:hypothetical protein